MLSIPDLQKVKIKYREEGIQNLAFPEIQEKQFISLLVGKPGSGKTTLIENLLLNQDLYFKKFEEVFIVSPSGFSELKMDPANSIKSLDILWLAQKLKNVQPGTKNILIVLDDVVSEIKKLERSPLLISLFYNRRNIVKDATISILITTQKYNLIPLTIRTVLTSLYIFDITHKEWQLLSGELFTRNEKDLTNLISQLNRKVTHKFLFIRLKPFKVYLNFKEIPLAGDFLQDDYEKYEPIVRKEEVKKIVKEEKSVTSNSTQSSFARSESSYQSLRKLLSNQRS